MEVVRLSHSVTSLHYKILHYTTRSSAALAAAQGEEQGAGWRETEASLWATVRSEAPTHTHSSLTHSLTRSQQQHKKKLTLLF
jgi:hypothetical protein